MSKEERTDRLPEAPENSALTVTTHHLNLHEEDGTVISSSRLNEEEYPECNEDEVVLPSAVMSEIPSDLTNPVPLPVPVPEPDPDFDEIGINMNNTDKELTTNERVNNVTEVSKIDTENNSDENNAGREPIFNQQESSIDLDGSEIINSGASEEEVSAHQIMNASNADFVDADVPVDKEMDITSCVEDLKEEHTMDEGNSENQRETSVYGDRTDLTANITTNTQQSIDTSSISQSDCTPASLSAQPSQCKADNNKNISNGSTSSTSINQCTDEIDQLRKAGDIQEYVVDEARGIGKGDQIRAGADIPAASPPIKARLSTPTTAPIAPSTSTSTSMSVPSATLHLTFPSPPTTACNNYTNKSWIEQNGSRKLVFCGQVSKFQTGKYFWSQDHFVDRTLALFENPHVLVIARTSSSGGTTTSSKGRQEKRNFNQQSNIRDALMVESVVDLMMCKLRLSTLTTPTSVMNHCNDEISWNQHLNKSISAMTSQSATAISSDGTGNAAVKINYRNLSCFEIITPSENISLSAMKSHENARATFAITDRWESEITHAILSAHDIMQNNTHGQNDKSLEKYHQSHAHPPQQSAVLPAHLPVRDDLTTWRHRHQLIIGTLHSYVLAGNFPLLKQSLADPGSSPDKPFPNINDRDGAGLTPLHYACYKRSQTLVSILLNAGADCSLPTSSFLGRNTPCHISASLLDEASLSSILACTKPYRADPNALNDKSETPMAVALNSIVGLGDKSLCVDKIRSWGGKITMRTTKAQDDAKGKNPLRTTRDDEESAKDKLFGNIGRAMKTLFSDNVEVEQQTQEVRTRTDSLTARNAKLTHTRPRDGNSAKDPISGLTKSLNATRNAFNERGERLNTLAEKTGALRHASEDFAKMAEELNKSQEKGIFGLW